jgi:hypothetical protein
MNWLEFILFALLGYAVFAGWPQPVPRGNWLVAIVFVVLMVLWLFLGVSGSSLGSMHFGR